MDLKELATQMLMDKLGGSGDSGAATSALEGLVGGGAQFDLGDMLGQFTGSGGNLARMAQSWLGDGKNEPISPAELRDAVGGDKLAAFAGQLGIGEEQAGEALSSVLPALVDKSSKGGTLLDSVNADDVFGIARKLFA